MVPKVAGKGASFKGAALYYLHDKGALTKERVAFSHTENLPTRNPDAAIKCMAWTAMHAEEIKARAGGSAKGRKAAYPVYSYSLSWSPEEAPTREQMIEAGKETLRVLGLDKHEALFVSHNDEPHPHLHVIVNRVNPETGISAPLGKDFLKLSKWAEDYERRMGRILCQQRVINNERRRNGEFVKDYGRDREARFYQERRERVRQAAEEQKAERQASSQEHQEQRKALYAEKETRIQETREAIRERYRPEWEKLRAIEKEERANLRKLQRNASHKVQHFLRDRPSEYIRMEKKDRGRFLSEMFDTHTRYATELTKKHKDIRAQLSREIKGKTTQALKEINGQYKLDLDSLRERQRREQQEAARRHSAESQERARDIREGRDREQFRDRESARMRREIGENARDMTKPRGSLSERFNRLKEQEADLEKAPAPLQAKQAPPSPQRARAEPQQKKPPEQEKTKPSLAERARRLREAANYIDKAKERTETEGRHPGAFRDNAGDVTRERGGKAGDEDLRYVGTDPGKDEDPYDRGRERRLPGEPQPKPKPKGWGR